MSDTPIVDVDIAGLETELGSGPPVISDAAIDVAVRLRLTDLARRLERDRAELIEVVRDFLEWNDTNDAQVAEKARALLARLEKE